MKYKAVFFDFDGTLMDTSKGIYGSGLKAMEALNIPIPENAPMRKFIGPPLAECFRITFGVTDVQTLDQLVDKYRYYYHLTGMYESEFYPYIPEVLATLRKRGYKTGIASMKRDYVIKGMCDVFKLNDSFDAFGGMINDEEDTKAEILLREAKKLGLNPSECVLVGDTEIDCKGAQDAHMDFIKVGWGFGYLPTDDGVINDARMILDLV